MTKNSQDNHEIDLGSIYKKITGFFQSIAYSIFDFILFVKRNIIIISILLIVGVLLGYFSDKNSKSYKNEIIVQPNFKSVDYLYSKVELLESKRREKDTAFFKNIGILDFKSLRKIEIEPVIDIYELVNDEDENFDLIKLLAENGDINKIIEDKTTSKNYDFHKITFTANEKVTNKTVIKPLLNYLNDSDYFLQVKNQHIENEKNKIKSGDSIIKQIDKLLLDYSKNISGNNLVYYNNENSQLNDIIETKEKLITQNGFFKVRLLSYKDIINETSTTLNIVEKPTLFDKKMIVYPLLLSMIFFVIVLFKNFYKSQLKKRNIS